MDKKFFNRNFFALVQRNSNDRTGRKPVSFDNIPSDVISALSVAITREPVRVDYFSRCIVLTRDDLSLCIHPINSKWSFIIYNR